MPSSILPVVLLLDARKRQRNRKILAMLSLSRDGDKSLRALLRKEAGESLQQELNLRKSLLKQAREEVEMLRKLLAEAQSLADDEQEEEAESIYDPAGLD
jgi:hypothetical protein